MQKMLLLNEAPLAAAASMASPRCKVGLLASLLPQQLLLGSGGPPAGHCGCMTRLW